MGCSDWIRVGQDRISGFAEVTEDRQGIHLDPDAGRAAGFDGTVAHGFLTLSMLSAFAYDAVPGVEGQTASVNYGFDRIRFTAPVPAGAEIRGRFVLSDFEERSDGSLMLVLGVTVEVRGQDAPALRAEWRILILF
nr:MaoC family dehydratase [uncultured Roseobacter sp.]